MDGYDGDSISEAEWNEADIEDIENHEDDECFEGPSDLFDD